MTAPEASADALLAGVLVVDVRHAGGPAFVDVDQSEPGELFAGCVRLETPGRGPIPLYPSEARALAAALNVAADYSEQRNAPAALHRGEGDDQNPNI